MKEQVVIVNPDSPIKTAFMAGQLVTIVERDEAAKQLWVKDDRGIQQYIHESQIKQTV